MTDGNPDMFGSRLRGHFHYGTYQRVGRNLYQFGVSIHVARSKRHAPL
jgi:hypothetical protein